MYVAPSIGRMLLSRAIGSVFFIATATIICIIKEAINARKQETMGPDMLPIRPIPGQCQYCGKGEPCPYRTGSEGLD